MQLPPEESKAIGEAVSILIKHKGLSKSQLGVNPSTLHSIENGKNDSYGPKALQTVLTTLECKDVPELLNKARLIQRWSKVTTDSDALHAKLVGQAVRILREDRHLGQDQLGVERTLVSRIESGKADQYSDKALQTILTALGSKNTGDLLQQAEQMERWSKVTAGSDTLRAELVGRAARILREDRQLTQSQLGVNWMAVSRIEGGKYDNYNPEMLQTVIAALGCENIEDLLQQASRVDRWSKVTADSDALRTELVGQAVHILRKDKHLTQDQLGVNGLAVSRIESGKKAHYSTEILQTVIAALGCKDIPDLLRQAEQVENKEAQEGGHKHIEAVLKRKFDKKSRDLP